MRLGQPVRRLEDERLLRGRGGFIDDLDLGGQAHAHFVRSVHAHARIAGIDTAAARQSPGVLAVYTGADLDSEGVGRIHFPSAVKSRDGTPMRNPVRPCLVSDKARHVGDTVAMVVAGSRGEARDAADLVAVEYEELPAVTGAAEALQPGAPLVWDEVPGNLAFDWEGGDRAAAEKAFAAARHVARAELVVSRVVVAAMEPRGALGSYDPHSGRYTLITPTQGTTPVQQTIARYGLKVPSTDLRVESPDVGGGFGMKNYAYPEQVLVLWASRKLGRPVKWYPERSDGFMTDAQGRDHRMQVELALDAEGRFLAIRCRTLSNLGAYATQSAPFIPTLGGTRVLTGVYTIPCFHAESRGVFTNTVPIDAYRGAGKPEFMYALERVVDVAARELKVDPAELRRRNIVLPSAMPYRTPTGLVFDSGEFARNMDDALVLADRPGFATRREEARKRGKLRGLGFSVYQEPDGFRDNRAELVFDPSGRLTLTVSPVSNGQGYVTTFAQVVSDQLGLPLETIRVVQADSDHTGGASGAGGSRTATVTGTAIARAAAEIVEKGRRIAAHLMEASAEDVEFADGAFRIAGTDRSVGLVEVAQAAFLVARLPPDMEFGLGATSHYNARAYSYPSGCHVAEVEIDPETGQVTLIAYSVVNDFGRVINPLLLEGQIQGGVVQGIGQALIENCVYDPGSGQLLTGAFTDYGIPRADDVPFIAWTRNEVPCKTNPLGIKGCGESGCTASIAAVMNAVVDALAEVGVTQVDMPTTPEKIWRLCRTGK
ncbi:MAG: xanthine dehydrogenase family protein molybdopterin-binding subunit [Proteobacteria bacterium]|nr:xanthine dehydrogenase family protein molybdopterin-binding subunit [Pseudomonadota bacterium]